MTNIRDFFFIENNLSFNLPVYLLLIRLENKLKIMANQIKSSSKEF